ncbi:hypothetical protein [Sphingomonas sp. 3-13AW]|uniref:hypothetical protein n=1 Tax=Sphingomonas sp. 3-13AW TaxID=3050450 RepID=UPI003BB79B44
MIQDLLKGLFGPQVAPVLPPQGEQTATHPAISASPPPPPAPPAPKASEHPKLPTVALPVVEAIEAKIQRILTTVGPTSIGDTTEKEVIDLRDVHLPALIASYIDIPADHRAQIFKEKGKSASYVLRDSLEIIASRLDATIADLARREISSFDDVNRFITDRYGSKVDPFA